MIGVSKSGDLSPVPLLGSGDLSPVPLIFLVYVHSLCQSLFAMYNDAFKNLLYGSPLWITSPTLLDSCASARNDRTIDNTL